MSDQKTYQYYPVFELQKDNTLYRQILKSETPTLIETFQWQDQEFLKIKPEAIKVLTEEAFSDVSHLLRASHLEKLSLILKDPESSDNDRFVAYDLLKNAVIAAEMEFPSMLLLWNGQGKMFSLPSPFPQQSAQ